LYEEGGRSSRARWLVQGGMDVLRRSGRGYADKFKAGGRWVCVVIVKVFEGLPHPSGDGCSDAAGEGYPHVYGGDVEGGFVSEGEELESVVWMQDY